MKHNNIGFFLAFEYRKCLRQLFLLLGVLVVAGCVSAPPLPPIDKTKLAAIRSIAIQIPDSPQITAAVGAAQPGFAGTNVGAAAITGGVSGYLNGYAQSRAAKFGDLVAERLPTLDLGLELAEASKTELSRRGFQTLTFRPASGESDKSQDAPDSLSSPTADAILILVPTVGYQAPGPLNAYARRVLLNVILVDAKTKNMILYRGFIYHRHFTDDYSYNTYNSLSEHLPEAVDGLRNALLDFVPLIGALLSGS